METFREMVEAAVEEAGLRRKLAAMGLAGAMGLAACSPGDPDCPVPVTAPEAPERGVDRHGRVQAMPGVPLTPRVQKALFKVTIYREEVRQAKESVEYVQTPEAGKGWKSAEDFEFYRKNQQRIYDEAKAELDRWTAELEAAEEEALSQR